MLVKKIEEYWINGPHDPKIWNMYDHRGVKTNNNAESYNSKLGNDPRIKKTPKPLHSQ